MLRVRASLEGDAEAGLVEDSGFYRAVGARIDELLDKVDLLARYGDDEFGILFVKKDAAQAARRLESVLAHLHAKPVVTEGTRYSVIGSAAVIGCQPPIGAASDFMRLLRAELQTSSEVGIRVVSIKSPKAANRSAGTGDT